MRSDLKPVFIGHICGMGRMHANQVQHIAVTPALGGANMLLPSWSYININRAFPFQILWISLNLWDCVNAIEISFLTFDQHQIRDLSLFFLSLFIYFLVRIRWVSLNHNLRCSVLNAKITENLKGDERSYWMLMN